MRSTVALTLLLASTRAHADTPAWIGVFRPDPPGVTPCECDKATVVGASGEVIVLSPGNGTPLPVLGDVTLVQPLLGMNIVAHVTSHGRAPVRLFAADRRDGDDAVLVLPADVHVVFVTPAPADVLAIRAALMKDEVLSGVRRALVGLEIGAIDIDGDRKADFAVTYGCNAWADGQCQSRGGFLLARRGGIWRELE